MNRNPIVVKVVQGPVSNAGSKPIPRKQPIIVSGGIDPPTKKFARSTSVSNGTSGLSRPRGVCAAHTGFMVSAPSGTACTKTNCRNQHPTLDKIKADKEGFKGKLDFVKSSRKALLLTAIDNA